MQRSWGNWQAEPRMTWWNPSGNQLADPRPFVRPAPGLDVHDFAEQMLDAKAKVAEFGARSVVISGAEFGKKWGVWVGVKIEKQHEKTDDAGI